LVLSLSSWPMQSPPEVFWAGGDVGLFCEACKSGGPGLTLAKQQQKAAETSRLWPLCPASLSLPCSVSPALSSLVCFLSLCTSLVSCASTFSSLVERQHKLADLRIASQVRQAWGPVFVPHVTHDILSQWLSLSASFPGQ
jgi:hypothetical protein